MSVISLGLLALMVSWPFLFPIHTAPIGSFWTEWWAGALGLSAAIFGLLSVRKGISLKIHLPPLLLIPAGLLVALLLQFAFSRPAFPQLGLLFAIYLIWAGLLLILGRHLADEVGLTRLVDVLAAGISFGALVSTAIAMMQWLGIAERMPYVFPASSLIWANIAQKNHFAQYCWLGIASVVYLCGRGRLPPKALWFLILPIAFASIVSNSRSVFLYWLVLLAALVWTRRREPNGPASALVIHAALLLPTLFALSILGTWTTPRVPEFWVWLAHLSPLLDFNSATLNASEAQMSGTQLLHVSEALRVRSSAFYPAMAAFLEHPWLGQGAGNFRWASFVAASKTDNTDFIVSEHAHNLIFHLLAEFGGPVVIVMLMILVAWAIQFLRQNWRLEHFWCASVLGFGAVHSMLEYPLWYSHFLGPTAVILGATSLGSGVVLTGRRLIVYLAIAAMAGTLILHSLRSDYSKIESTISNPFGADPDRETSWWISMDHLLMLHEESLLSPWALRAIVVLAEPNRSGANERADLCQHAIRFAVERRIITRCAIHLAIAGRSNEAQKLLLDTLRAFPRERSETSKELANEVQAFPEIRTLWALSLQK